MFTNATASLGFCETAESLTEARRRQPLQRNLHFIEEFVHWNYKTVLNIIFLMLALVLVIRFLRTAVLKRCA